METSEILLSSFLLFFFFFLLRPAGACRRSCSADGKVDVRFPFNIVNGSSSTTTDRCGFGPGFGLTCKNNQPVLNLPMAGDFIVDLINYETQRVWIKDPEDCIPKRLLNFTLSESPFQTLRGTKRRFRLMSCNMNNFTIPPAPYVYHFWSESCVSETNHAIVAVDATNREIHEDCHEIKNVSFSLPRWTYFGEWFLELIWDNPDCKSCEVSGGTCGYKGRTGSDVKCFKPSSHGFPRSAKYGLIIGVGIPGLLCIIGLLCVASGKIQAAMSRRHFSGTDLAISIGSQPTTITMGLDGSIIESYPKTVLGESRRLSKPNDFTCSICLSDYQPKDTIRTIPECNHCFHIDCIDEWLKINTTCPVCRNSPFKSSTLLSSPSSSTLES